MKNDFLNDLRIASPCPAAWHDMTGTDQVRLCSQCDLHVYDISQLTRDETAALIAKSEGRICARLHRRADGTVITRDCPVGLRALTKRVARRAGAALTAILSLSTSIFAQSRTPSNEAGNNQSTVKIEREQSPELKAMITGTVTDLIGSVIGGARVTLIDNVTNEQLTISTNDAGEFSFAPNSKNGHYTLRIESSNFKKMVLEDVMPKAGEVLRLSLMLEVDLDSITMGRMSIEVEPIPVDQNGPLLITPDLIRKWPH